MGSLSFDSVVSTGLNKAGRTDLSALANTWLNAWLRSQYAAWPWPFLHRRKTGLSLTAGTTSLSVGAGNGGVTAAIRRIFDPIWVYDSTYSTRRIARIRTLLQGSESGDETINDPSISRAMPEVFKVRADSATWGAWSLIPHPVPEKNYLLAIDYLEQPADISGSTVPLYPNDRTMIQAVLVDALQYLDKRPDYLKELEVLGAMVIDDRMKFGSVDGTNDQLAVDPGVFL